MLLSPQLHGHGAVVIGPAAVSPCLPAEPKSGEHARELGDLLVAVSGNRLAEWVELSCAIRVQFPKADTEKLLHLARIILIWILVDLGPRFLVADVTEVTAHHRMKR